jgi:hypothetical protein
LLMQRRLWPLRMSYHRTAKVRRDKQGKKQDHPG